MDTHISVMHNEVLQHLQIEPHGTYVDMTLGAGGHAASILEALHGGYLVAFDLELQAISNFVEQQSLQKVKDAEYADARGNKVYLIHANFATVQEVLTKLGITQVAGIIADLGWASEQLERIPGLSYQGDDVLDMRLDQTQGITAAELLNQANPDVLQQIFASYADIHGSWGYELTQAIVQHRQKQPFASVSELRGLVETLPIFKNQGKQMVARVFQAVRIAVNNELSTLQSALRTAWDVLKPEGRILIITFHSGEANIVEAFGAEVIKSGIGEWLFAQKHLRPTVNELKKNLRAHSAKLWGLTKHI